MFYFIIERLKSDMAKNSRPIYCILFGRQENSFKKTRYAGRLMCGLLLALFYWQIIVWNFSFSFKWRIITLILLFVIFGLGFVFSLRIKCVSLLMLIGLVGKSGRSYLRALSFAFIIAGPIGNLANNAQEIVRVYSCTAKLHENLTRTRYDLMTKPFLKTLANMKGDIKEVQDTFAEFKNVLEPLRNEVENDDPENATYTPAKTHPQRRYRKPEAEAKAVQQRYSKKFEKRCQRQLAKGEVRCKDAFKNARENCMAKFPRLLRSLLCWPFRVDFICDFNVLGDPETICDPSEALPSDFGETYVDLKRTEAELVQSGSNVSVKYTVHKIQTPAQLKHANETAQMVMNDFKQKKSIFDFIMYIIERCLSLLLIRVVIVSIKYQKKYIKDKTFDNVYVSDYFKRIDERRSDCGKQHLMPLKKFEKKTLVDVDKPCELSKDESKDVIFHLIQFSLELIMAFFFLTLDYVVVTLLDIIHKRSEITYMQDGEHNITFHINGTGLMAKLMRSTLKNFNIHEKVHTYLSNEVCLPKATSLPQSYYIKLGAIYLTIILLIYKSSVFLRMRHLICAYFYRTLEKERILYLYNSLRRQRRYLFEEMLKFAKLNIAKQKVRRKYNLILRLRLSYPKYFNWLKYFKMARRKCLICEGLEDNLFIVCSNESCGSVYCEDCWHDLDTDCVYCNQQIKIINILNFQDFFEEYTKN